MGVFGDEISGNFFSPELMSSTRYFSKMNEHSLFPGGGLGPLDFDHRYEPVHGVEYIIPTKYMMNRDLYKIHFVVYCLKLNPTGRASGLSHSSSAPVIADTYSQYGLYNKEFYS